MLIRCGENHEKREKRKVVTVTIQEISKEELPEEPSESFDTTLRPDGRYSIKIIIPRDMLRKNNNLAVGVEAQVKTSPRS